MGNVYVKKDIPSAITNLLESTGIGQSPAKIAREVAERQIGDFDFSQGATPLFGDPEAGKWGPKDRHGKSSWEPQYPSGEHLVETEKNIADLAARGIPYSRAISMVLGGLSAVDSLANAQPGQSVLGMAHNAAARGYLTHLGASSFLDSPAAAMHARLGRGRMERENTKDPYAPLPVPPPPSTTIAPPSTTIAPLTTLASAPTTLVSAPTTLASASAPTTLTPYSTEDVEVSPRQPYTHGMIPNVATPESHTIAPDMRELIENRAIDGAGVMEQQRNMSPALGNQYAYLQEEYPFGVDTTSVASPSGNQAGATPPSSNYTPDMHQRLLEEYG
ncbi:MAG: hypothetical protein CXX81_07370, partial [Methanobacteriota archaeon]